MDFTQLPAEILRRPAHELTLDGLPIAEVERIREHDTVGDALRDLPRREADRIADEISDEDRILRRDLLLMSAVSVVEALAGELPPVRTYASVADVLAGRAWPRPSARDQQTVRTALEALVADRREIRRGMIDRQRLRSRPKAPLDVPYDAVLAAWRRALDCFPTDVLPESLACSIDGEGLFVGRLGAHGASLKLPDGAELPEDRQNEPVIRLAVIDRLLRALTDAADPLHAALARHYSSPGWERALARLDRVMTPPAALVVGWKVVERLEGLWFRPVQCTPKKKGGLSTRNLDAHDLPELADPVDERVRALLARWKVPPEEVVEGAARLLVGHPRVFSPTGKPASVVRTELRLALRAGDDGQVRPRFEIDGELVDVGEMEDGDGAWLRWRAERSELQVVEVRRHGVRRLASWVREQPVLPGEARGALLERLPALAAQVDLALDPDLRGEAVPGDLRPLLRLAWDGEALRVSARIRPLPEAASHLPGEGPAELMTVREGRTVHAARSLDAEPAQVEGLARELGLDDRHRTGWGWVVGREDGAIDVLLALADQSAAFQSEWEGDRPVVTRARTSQVRVSVVGGRRWFEVDGSVELDDAGILTLAEVLAAIREGRSFLPARSGALVRLADDLRRSLAPIAVADEGGRLAAAHAPTLEALAESGASVDGEDVFRASMARIRAAQHLEPPIPPALEADLRHYQVEGFRWLVRVASWAPGAVLADDMGLGKTVQAIALLLARPGTSLVVCPLSVVANWEAELARFAPTLRVVRYHGASRASRLAEAQGAVVVTTWDLLARDADALATVPFRTAVFDEAQAIKNAGTRRAGAATRIHADFALAMTGTPVENRADELWSLFNVVAPGLLGGDAKFQQRFAAPIERGDLAAREALAGVVRPFVLRRSKALVAPELPPRVEVVLPVPLSSAERALYERARLEAVARTAEASGGAQRMEVFRWLTVLRQLACNPRLVDAGSPVASSKLEVLRRRIGELRAAGHRALVFSQFVGHLELVRDALAEDGASLRWLTGALSAAERQREVAAFQGGDGDVFLISLGAGGTGLNLTAATYVFHLDPWWNPAKEDQASDRAHRIGQDQPVTVYRLVAEGTIEEQILRLHADKRELADALLAGASASARIPTDELIALLAGGEAELDVVDAEPVASELLSAFERALEADLAAGRLKTRATARNYVAAVGRLLGTTDDLRPEGLEAAAQRYLAEIDQVGTKTDKTFGPPAFRRLVALARAGEVSAK